MTAAARRGSRARLVLQPSPACAGVAGLWWPYGRVLADELPLLWASWPLTEGHIVGVSYAPVDWDDRPLNVAIPQRRGLLPTRTLAPAQGRLLRLTMLNGIHLTLVTVAPDASDGAVAETFDRLAFSSPRPDWLPRRAQAFRSRRLR